MRRHLGIYLAAVALIAGSAAFWVGSVFSHYKPGLQPGQMPFGPPPTINTVPCGAGAYRPAANLPCMPNGVVAPVSSTQNTATPDVTIALQPNCVWSDGTTAKTLSFPATDVWEFINNSGAGRYLKWVSGTHYATNYWLMGNGEGLIFSQAGPTSTTFTTCSGKVILNINTQ